MVGGFLFCKKNSELFSENTSADKPISMDEPFWGLHNYHFLVVLQTPAYMNSVK